MNTKAQGDMGVAMAISYYLRQGYTVCLPFGDNARYDLIVEIDGVLKRVQCKTSSFKEKGYYKVTLKTSGGNKTGTSTKLISKDEVDLVFIYTLDNNCYEFPPEEFDGKVSLTLGPKKQVYRVS